MTSETFKRHSAQINAGKVTKTTVIGMRKALNAMDRRDRGYSVSRASPRITFDELDELVNALHHLKPRVIGELHDSGIKQLQNKRYRRQLEPVAAIVANLDHFRLVDFEDAGSSRLAYYVPIYEAVAKDGRTFRFRNVPWQSGGNGPELID